MYIERRLGEGDISINILSYIVLGFGGSEPERSEGERRDVGGESKELCPEMDTRHFRLESHQYSLPGIYTF